MAVDLDKLDRLVDALSTIGDEINADDFDKLERRYHEARSERERAELHVAECQKNLRKAEHDLERFKLDEERLGKTCKVLGILNGSPIAQIPIKLSPGTERAIAAVTSFHPSKLSLVPQPQPHAPAPSIQPARAEAATAKRQVVRYNGPLPSLGDVKAAWELLENPTIKTLWLFLKAQEYTEITHSAAHGLYMKAVRQGLITPNPQHGGRQRQAS